MLILITYDIDTSSTAGKRRLHKVEKICANYGQRVQQSVFECVVDFAMVQSIRDKLLITIKKEEDSLRIYNLGNNYRNRIESYGVQTGYDPEGVLIV